MAVRFSSDIIPAEYVERIADAHLQLYGMFEAQGAVTTCCGLTVGIAAIDAGQYFVNGNYGAVRSATTVSVGAADACCPRIDIIAIDKCAAITANAGTAAASPVPPDIGACKLHLSQVNVAAGQTVLTACDLTDMRQIVSYHRIIVKPCDETITCSTALQVDCDLKVDLAACTTYVYTMALNTIGNATCDLQFDFSVPACTTMERQHLYVNNSATLTFGDGAAATAVAINGCTPVTEWGSIVVGGTAGTVNLRFAQNSSGANATGINSGSWLEVKKAV